MNPHKCRVYRDRWNHYWVVHCHFSDMPIASYRRWVYAVELAIRHHRYTTDTTGRLA